MLQPRRSLTMVLLLASVALAAEGCVRPAAVPAPPVTLDDVAPLPAEPDPDVEPPQVVIRDWTNAPSSTVVAWQDDEWRQGLRGTVSSTGKLVRDHLVYVGAQAFPNLAPFQGAIWHAWVDGVRFPKPLLVNRLTRDLFFCQRSDGCTPYEYLSARVPDGMLRASRDSLVVNIIARNGIHERTVVLHRPLIDAYLAKLDSVRQTRARLADN